MLKNFLTIAWRNLSRNKIFTVINILGPAIGMACCILVSLFIRDELSYGRQNIYADRIYRVVADFINDNGSKVPDAATPPALSTAINREIPEIECVARLFPGWGNKFYVRNGDKKFIEENVYHADSSIFSVFTIRFLKGNAKIAMDNPHAIILTESMAKKYFGNSDPIGKTLEVDDWAPCLVTGVVRGIPGNAHFSFDFLVPLKRFLDERAMTIWFLQSFYTYIKLRPGSDIIAVDKKIRALVKKASPENKNYFFSQALTAIHLSSNLKSELRPNGDKTYIYIFGAVSRKRNRNKESFRGPEVVPDQAVFNRIRTNGAASCRVGDGDCLVVFACRQWYYRQKAFPVFAGE